MTFKLGDIRDVQSVRVELRHPAGNAPLGAFIELAGPEHPRRRALALANAKKLREAFARTGKFVLDEDPDADELETLVAVTLGWEITGPDGNPLAFNAEAVRALYADREQQWIVRQVRAALEDAARFIASSAPS